MKLEQFREIADENLQDLVVDERMLQRVHQKMCTVTPARRPAVPRQAFALAAACIAVMLVSGGVLLGTMGVGNTDPIAQTGIAAAYKQPTNSASTLSANAHTSEYADGTVLSYGIEKVGEYCEGYAPALATNGLYGIVDEKQIWVVKAIYEDVRIEKSRSAVVILQGVEQNIEIPVK